MEGRKNMETLTVMGQRAKTAAAQLAKSPLWNRGMQLAAFSEIW